MEIAIIVEIWSKMKHKIIVEIKLRNKGRKEIMDNFM
jgi:hypothetical protein